MSEYFERIVTNHRFIKGHSEPEVVEKLDALLKSAEHVNGVLRRVSNKLNFENIPCNGFVLYLTILDKFTDRVVKQLKTNNKIHPNYIKLFDVLSLYQQSMYEVDRALKEQNKDSLLTSQEHFSSSVTYDVIHQDENNLQLVYSTEAGFWLDDFQKNWIKGFIKPFALFCSLPFSISVLFSDYYFGKYYVEAVKNCTLDYPWNLFHKAESGWINRMMINRSNKNVPVYDQIIWIPENSRFRLDYKGNILDFDHMSKEQIDSYMNDKAEQERVNAPGKRHRNKDKVRCKYYRINNEAKLNESVEKIRKKRENGQEAECKLIKHHTARRNFDPNIEPRTFNESNSEKIIAIFIHGGGFFTLGSSYFEIYLKRFCNSLAGVPILSIDYSLTVPYPVPNQEILDVYLWLFSGGEDVEKTLGFHPKKAVLYGCSAGGFFEISLTITLNELNKILIRNSEDKIPLPKSIVAAYPLTSLIHHSPSKAIFIVESMIEIHPLLLVASLYGANLWSIGEMKKIENTPSFKEIEERNKHLNLDNKTPPLKNNR